MMNRTIVALLMPLLMLQVVCAQEKDQQGNPFKTVKIGAKTWMASNLNTAVFRNGDPIPEAKTDEEWEKAGEAGKPAWCYFENKTENGTTYGRLYNWYAVSDPRGLAPKGWHIPSQAEWELLIKDLGGDKAATPKLKTKEGWDENANGNNASGFNALPSGGRKKDGLFDDSGIYAFWWSKDLDPEDKTFVLNWALTVDEYPIGKGNSFKANGLAVRCVKD